MIRRLLAALLLPTALLSAPAPDGAPPPAEHRGATFAAVEAISAGPALPGSAAALLSAPDAPAQQRAPVRHGPDAVHMLRADHPVERTRATQLERGYLGYARAIERARLSQPATCGNPPPASLV